jgi:hypothetical protein
MARLLAAAMLLVAAAAPAFACELQKSAASDTQKRTATSQPAYPHSTPAPSTTTGRKSS